MPFAIVIIAFALLIESEGSSADSGNAGVTGGKYIETEYKNTVEAVSGIHSIITNQMGMATAMSAVSRTMSSMSNEATKAAAMVQILSTALDLVQRSMIQLETIASEEEKVSTSIRSLLEAMQRLVLNQPGSK